MSKRRLVVVPVILVGFFASFLALNQLAYAKERVVQFDNPGCE